MHGNAVGRPRLGVGEPAAVSQLDARRLVVLARAQYPLPHELIELGRIVDDRPQLRPAGNVLVHLGLLDVAGGDPPDLGRRLASSLVRTSAWPCITTAAKGG